VYRRCTNLAAILSFIPAMVRSSCRVADSSLQVMAFRVAQANRVWGYSLSSSSMVYQGVVRSNIVYQAMCSNSIVGWLG